MLRSTVLQGEDYQFKGRNTTTLDLSHCLGDSYCNLPLTLALARSIRSWFLVHIHLLTVGLYVT